MTRSILCRLAFISMLPLGLTGCTGLPSGPSASPPIVVVASTTTLAATPNPATPGAVILLTATVGSTGASSGVVTFYDGSTMLGTAPSLLMNGQATLMVSTFTNANTTHQITAVYSGDALNATSTSAPFAVIIGGAVAPTSITTHGSFSFNTANQTITGFGAAEAFDLTYLTAHPYASEMYKALYDPTSGLGLQYLRVQNLYRPGVTGFDTDTPKIVAAANAAHGTPLTLLMSSWSPPANLKSNGSVNGCSPIVSGACPSGSAVGTLVQVNGAYDYADFAQYWSDSLTAYSVLGVIPNFISIQNEPDFTAPYTGNRFNPTEATYNGTNFAGYGLAFDAVYKKIQGLATVPAMIGPETLGIFNTFFDIAAQIPAGETKVYAHHNYSVSSGSVSSTGTVTPGGNPDGNIPLMQKLNAAYPTAQRWASEYYDTPGFFNALTIHNALSYANDNAYIFWQATWPSVLTTAKDQGGDQAGLLYVDNPYTPNTWAFAHGWSYNDAYYALKHYSYFVRPGYIRYNAVLDVTTNERMTVFQSPDKQTTVIVILNVNSAAGAGSDGIALDLSNITYKTSTVYRSNFSQPILTGERLANLGAYIAPSGSGTVNNSGGIVLPPMSAVTVVLKN